MYHMLWILLHHFHAILDTALMDLAQGLVTLQESGMKRHQSATEENAYEENIIVIEID